MNDWREHNGGPQPVDDETWVVAPTSDMWAPEVKPAKSVPWRYATGRYRILNQHLIDAARLEGIRLGLEAAATHLTEGGWVPEIMSLDPETIAREAALDKYRGEP